MEMIKLFKFMIYLFIRYSGKLNRIDQEYELCELEKILSEQGYRSPNFSDPREDSVRSFNYARKKNYGQKGVK